MYHEKDRKRNAGIFKIIKEKIEIIRTLAYFGIVIAILLLGYFQTGTKLNLLTVVAIVGCLPASKALVGVITRFPYRSIDGERAKEIASKLIF